MSIPIHEPYRALSEMASTMQFINLVMMCVHTVNLTSEQNFGGSLLLQVEVLVVNLLLRRVALVGIRWSVSNFSSGHYVVIRGE